MGKQAGQMTGGRGGSMGNERSGYWGGGGWGAGGREMGGVRERDKETERTLSRLPPVPVTPRRRKETLCVCVCARALVCVRACVRA